MSNHLPRSIATWLVVVGLVLLTQPARGQEDLDPIAAWADAVTRRGPWRGPVTPYPDPEPRPALPLRACSTFVPVCVHAGTSVPPARLERVLAAFEAAEGVLAARAAPLPWPDGGAGGTLELDVYLDAELTQPARVALDGALDRALTLGLDGGSVYVRLRQELVDARLDGCAIEALALAGLRAQDPAEEPSVLAGIARFEGSLGQPSASCVPNAIERAQAAPEVGVLGDRAEPESDPAPVTTLALALELASRRHDGGSGRFVREVFQLARQTSEGTVKLRASPSFFEALDRALQNAGESLDALMEELAIERYLLEHPRDASLPSLGGAAAPSAQVTHSFEALPHHLLPHEPPLLPYGSAYAEVPVASARNGARLDVWLRGELGARYSLCAVRLDRDRRELGRMCAPPRKVPDAFLPVELERGTQLVLLVTTRMPGSMRELLEPITPHAFRLIVKAS